QVPGPLRAKYSSTVSSATHRQPSVAGGSPASTARVQACDTRRRSDPSSRLTPASASPGAPRAGEPAPGMFVAVIWPLRPGCARATLSARGHHAEVAVMGLQMLERARGSDPSLLQKMQDVAIAQRAETV